MVAGLVTVKAAELDFAVEQVNLKVVVLSFDNLLVSRDTALHGEGKPNEKGLTAFVVILNVVS